MGFQYLWNSSQDMAHNTIYSPWGGTNGPWLHSVTKLLLLGLVFLCFCTFSLLWIYSLTKVFLQTKGRQRTWRGSTIGSCSISCLCYKMKLSAEGQQRLPENPGSVWERTRQGLLGLVHRSSVPARGRRATGQRSTRTHLLAGSPHGLPNHICLARRTASQMRRHRGLQQKEGLFARQSNQKTGEQISNQPPSRHAGSSGYLWDKE